MASALDKQALNLDYDQCNNSREFCIRDDGFKLRRHKYVYPFEYTDSSKKFIERKLPPNNVF